MSKPQTVRVRIAVAVDAERNWSASGWLGASDKGAADEACMALWGNHTHLHWVEADIPLPIAAVIEGEVKPHE